MRSVAIVGTEAWEMREEPTAHAAGEYAVVKNHVVPMCTEFKDFFAGEPADYLGHEAAGEVIEVAQPSKVTVGDRVVVMPGYPCGTCRHCLSGEYIYCEDRVDPAAATGNVAGFGTYAEYVVKADRLLVPIPDGMSYKHAAMACCGLGPALNAVKTLQLDGTDVVLVAGLGPVGLGTIVVAQHFGARVICVARNPYRLALGERLGVSAVINAHDPDAMEQLRELSGGGPTAAVDTSGAAIYIKLLIGVLRRRGKLAIIGEGGEVPIAISDGLIRNGLKVYGLWHYSLALTKLMIEMIAAVSDQLDVLITHEFPLDRVEDAWRLQQSGRCGKVILRP